MGGGWWRAVVSAALAGLLFASACGGGGGGPAARTFVLDGRPMVDCLLQGGAAAKCGSLSLAENPAAPGGRRIDVAVRVIPAKDASRDAPVFFLSGGPGGAAIEDWATAPHVFAGLNARHDIVLVDQRGTGLSHRMTVPERVPGEGTEEYAKRVLEEVDGDVRYYTTAVAMDDLDAVRAALGYDRIDLYGGSYGATAAQYYVRQHAGHVAAVVLDGATLLDVPIMELVARNSQLALDGLFARCEADASCARTFPRVREEFAQVLSRLDAHPVKTGVVNADGSAVTITRDYFAGVVHNKLLTAADAASLPRLIHRAWLGDLSELASSQGLTLPNLIMSIEIRCWEAWARWDPRETARTGAGSYLVHAQYAAAQLQQSICPLLPRGIVPADDGRPLRTSLPVLLLTGAADPQDPPANVAGAATQMPSSVRITVPAQGHTVGHIGCLPTVVVDFFDRSKVDEAAAAACAATVAPPAFEVA